MSKLPTSGQPNESNGKVAVVGANSHLGRRVVIALGSCAVPIARSPLPAEYGVHTSLVSDYRSIPSDLLDGCTAVVNCVGIAAGNPALLQTVNVDLCLAVRRIAKESGILRFVHISSFAVYGHAERIDGNTNEIPTDAYGISKLSADCALLSEHEMDVAILRFPAIVGKGVPSKLSRLAKMWRKLGVFPIVVSASRSMISVNAAAMAVSELAQAPMPVRGKWLVADPTPVSLYALSQLAQSHRLPKLRALVFPSGMADIARKLSPRAFRKIFGSSILSSEANAFFQLGLSDRLEDELVRMLKDE